MRKLLQILITACAVFLATAPLGAHTVYIQVQAQVSPNVFAVLPADTPLQTPAGTGFEPKVTLPATHYVQVLSAEGGYYRVIYGDLTGYVRQTAVTLVDYEPQVKFAYGGISLKPGIASVFLYETAATETVIASIGGASQVAAYGYLSIADRVFFCRLQTQSGIVYGYVAATGVDYTPPPPNDGKRVDSADVPPAPSDPDRPAPIGEETLQVILVVSLAVPAAIMVLLLFSKKKSGSES